MKINDNKIIQGVILNKEEYQNDKFKYDNENWLEKRYDNFIFIPNKIPYCILQIDISIAYKKIINRSNVLLLLIVENENETNVYINDLKKINKNGCFLFNIKHNEYIEKEYSKVLEFLKLYYGHEIHIIAENTTQNQLVGLILDKYENSALLNKKVYSQIANSIQLSEKQIFKFMKYSLLILILFFMYFISNMIINTQQNEDFHMYESKITTLTERNKSIDDTILILKGKDEFVNFSNYKNIELKEIYKENNNPIENIQETPKVDESKVVEQPKVEEIK